jgi:hypothetical protein
MPAEFIVCLQEASREIRAFVRKLSAESGKPDYAAFQGGEWQTLTHRLGRVAKLLRSVPAPAPRSTALQAATAEYVHNLESLKRVIGQAQDSLSRERDKLQRDMGRLGTKRAWAESLRTTHDR